MNREAVLQFHLSFSSYLSGYVSLTWSLFLSEIRPAAGLRWHTHTGARLRVDYATGCAQIYADNVSALHYAVILMVLESRQARTVPQR
jgi:hypothetical protein